MVVDIHALLEKNPVTKAMLKPKFGYKYLAEEGTNKSIESISNKPFSIKFYFLFLIKIINICVLIMVP